MSWLPKSRKARRRLTLLAVIAPILAVAVALALWGFSDSISFFYTPSQAHAAKPPPGRAIQLGGMVKMGSRVNHPDGKVDFVVVDQTDSDRVTYVGDEDLPALFREGQGVVAMGAYRADGVFEARRVLAKHDEKYMPRNLEKALKSQGEWRGDGQVPDYAKAAPK
jgi:cytochrome c-type biogenesis protein CcmE